MRSHKRCKSVRETGKWFHEVKAWNGESPLQVCSLSAKKEALSFDIALTANRASTEPGKQGAALPEARRRHQGGVWGVEAMGTVEPNPPGVIGAWGVSGDVSAGEGEAAVAISTDAVVIHAMPRMASGNTNVTASVAHAVVEYGPLKAKMLALCEDTIRVLDSNRKAHEKETPKR